MSAHALPTTPQPIPRLRPLRTRSDEALRAMSARGDAAAFAELYERHHAALYRYCRSILHHDEDARDALHTTMTNAWASLQRADREVPLRPWLFRIAHNEAITILRRRRPHDELDDVHAATGRSLEEVVEERQRLDALRADLADLPERQRSALLLRELCGLAHTEIGAVLAVTPAVAKQSIFEARTALHEAEAGRQMTCAEVRVTLSDGDGRVRRGRRIKGHLRACGECAAFQEALRARPAQLAALFPPLPGAASVGLLARLLSSAGASGGATSAVAGTGAASLPVAGATGAAASGLAAKLVAGSLVALAAGGLATGGLATGERIVGDAGPRAARVVPSAPSSAGAASPDRTPTRTASEAHSVARSPVDPTAGGRGAPSSAADAREVARSRPVPATAPTATTGSANGNGASQDSPGRNEPKQAPDARPAGARLERLERLERPAHVTPSPRDRRPSTPPGLDRAAGERRGPAASRGPEAPKRAARAEPAARDAPKVPAAGAQHETGPGRSNRPDRPPGQAAAPAGPDVVRAPAAARAPAVLDGRPAGRASVVVGPPVTLPSALPADPPRARPVPGGPAAEAARGVG